MKTTDKQQFLFLDTRATSQVGCRETCPTVARHHSPVHPAFVQLISFVFATSHTSTCNLAANIHPVVSPPAEHVNMIYNATQKESPPRPLQAQMRQKLIYYRRAHGHHGMLSPRHDGTGVTGGKRPKGLAHTTPDGSVTYLAPD